MLPMTSKIFHPSKIVSLVSEMKWKLYGRRFYWKEFFTMLLLVGCLLVEIFYLHYNNEINESKKKIIGFIFHGIMSVLLLRLTNTELK